jgi:hypothetical protein
MISNYSEAESKDSPVQYFQHYYYQRHNHRRLEHLATLGLPLRAATVLEVGAGIGDHTHFFLDRNCHVTSVEAREENLNILRLRYPQLDIRQLDLDHPQPIFDQPFDIVYCYGLLYHLNKPAEAIEFMAHYCRQILLLESCVSYGDEEALNPCEEPVDDPTQSYSGQGCKPTRKWIYNQLQKWFEFVYLPTTQPYHGEFPIDWTIAPSTPAQLTRSIFVASKTELFNPQLIRDIPTRQCRY